ncbi:C-type lectin domain family 4 member G-like [Scomber japonicus]|uniref:C-type lectin domain family 4 member G-like n=1 Tax=Scomber japonicus TaxID=13676 RepID=UPI0023069FDC|nr:C-type lectin domain family 4 member G-like [Scomber japonicus]
MEEEEINYASVVFKTKTNSRPEVKKEEEIVYDEVKVAQKKAEQAADGLLADQKATTKHRHYQLMACCLGIFCVILLFSIIAVSVYLSLYYYENNVRELKQLKESQTTLLEINRNLTDLNNTLSSENERLRRDNDNQTVIIGNLIKKYNVSEMKIANLTEENTKLTVDKKQLETQNQQLEKEKNILTEQIRNMDNNFTVTQQIIDAYCPIENGNRQCKPCLDGWLHHQSSCYVIHNADPADQKTWEEAQENCRGKNSDLAVIVNEDEKTFISVNSWGSSGLSGYWIGLRAEAEKWKWIDGSDLTKKSWITQPANNGYCAMSVHNQGWKSVSCGNKNRWICEKAALSV